MNDDKALAPQIFNDETYCGDYEAFINAVEEENGIWDFLKLPRPEAAGEASTEQPSGDS